MNTDSLTKQPDLSDVFKKYQRGVPELLTYHDILLRGESPLTIAEREVIAAYISGLNACRFCTNAHTVIAGTFGFDEGRIQSMINDLESSDESEKLKVLLRYMRKLTLDPAKTCPEDRELVLKAGWCERALFDAVSVCALFNFMNRIVEGMGVTTSSAIKTRQKEDHSAVKEVDQTYRNYGRSIGIQMD